jgi:fatty-acyl-CoA synthase
MSMPLAHMPFWPAHAMPFLSAPATNLFYNADVSAERYPDKPFLIFYDTPVSFAEFRDEATRVAGFLERHCGVVAGDRVLLLMQNSPQFVVGYYGILRANAVVVPLNPMNLTQEILKFAQDARATTILVSQELYPRVEPLLQNGDLAHVIVTAYSDYLKVPTTLPLPDFLIAPRITFDVPNVSLWRDVLASGLQPGPLTAGADDLCVMPYTSGTTGGPRGCMHTHRTVMHTAVGIVAWFAIPAEMTLLAVAPMFHVTGMQASMNSPLYAGNTVVLLSRWDREVAAQCVQRYKVTSWSAVPTMIQDFFQNPDIDRYDVSSIRRLNGGGAAMPAAVSQRLQRAGITYIEGYGLTETISATHINPPHRPKPQCLGIPIYGVDSRVVDPVSSYELPAGSVGEIVIHGPQVFRGYWNRPQETASAFVEIDGKAFFRSGDLGRIDEDGYFFMIDRLKRMINASGFKVWPSEVESAMYQHPAIEHACVIGVAHVHRGETVKAVIVLKSEWRGKIDPQSIIDWSRENMAAYKVPRIIEFVDALPMSGSGKIMWRELQMREEASSRARSIGSPVSHS